MTEKKEIPYSRAMPGKGQHPKQVRAHVIKVCEITWAWNRLHSQFATLFVALCDTPENRIGKYIWHSINSDKSQRDMLLAIAKHKLTKEQYKKLSWATDQTAKLSTFRNAFVHAPMIQNINDGELSPFATTEKTKDKINTIYAKKTKFSDLRGDIIQLEQYVGWLNAEIIGIPIPIRDKPISRILNPNYKKNKLDPA